MITISNTIFIDNPEQKAQESLDAIKSAILNNLTPDRQHNNDVIQFITGEILKKMPELVTGVTNLRFMQIATALGDLKFWDIETTVTDTNYKKIQLHNAKADITTIAVCFLDGWMITGFWY